MLRTMLRRFCQAASGAQQQNVAVANGFASDVTESGVRSFFSPVVVQCVKMRRVPPGSVLLWFRSRDDLAAALHKDMQYFGSRYITVHEHLDKEPADTFTDTKALAAVNLQQGAKFVERPFRTATGHSVRLLGVPKSTTVDAVRQFLHPLLPANIDIVRSPNGAVLNIDIDFVSNEDKVAALRLDGRTFNNTGKATVVLENYLSASGHCLIMRGVHLDITEETVAKLIAPHRAERIVVARHRSGVCAGRVYLDFADQPTLDAVYQGCHRRTFGTHTVYFTKYIPPESPASPHPAEGSAAEEPSAAAGGATVRVSGFAQAASESEVAQFLAPVKPDAVRVTRDAKGNFTHADIQLSSAADKKLALTKNRSRFRRKIISVVDLADI